MSETFATPRTHAPRRELNIARLWFGLSEPVSRRSYLTTGVLLMALKYTIDAGLAALVTGRFFSPIDYLNPLMFMRAKALGHLPQDQVSALRSGVVVDENFQRGAGVNRVG